MNIHYFQLIPQVFSKAKFIIDRSHIVQHLNRVFNTFRIKEFLHLRQENHQYIDLVRLP
ncbi:transposase [Enterococcus sp. BWB1-3]|nr:transposase [Enterococcus sp. BWB1-3]MCB5952570.1 transposase [Enterococcus sp. BWT-B8]MCB5953388.1 transposase [Enterococcus sp. CWB-B31]